MKARFIALCVMLISACDRGSEQPAPPAFDQSQLSSSSGEVTLSDGGSLSYDITSEQYKQWYRAQESLDQATAERFGAILRPGAPTGESMTRATSFLESQPRARQAIQREGLSVRSFVTMTVALQQQLRDAAAAGEAPPIDPIYMIPPPIDTSLPMQPPISMAPIEPLPAPPTTLPPAYDTSIHVLPPPRDTMDAIRRPLPSPAIPRESSVVIPRPDTLVRPPVRDSMPRPTPAPAPVPVPDTTFGAADSATTPFTARDSLPL